MTATVWVKSGLCALAVGVIGMATFFVAQLATLACSGDTDVCDPGWVNVAGPVLITLVGAAVAYVTVRRVWCSRGFVGMGLNVLGGAVAFLVLTLVVFLLLSVVD